MKRVAASQIYRRTEQLEQKASTLHFANLLNSNKFFHIAVTSFYGNTLTHPHRHDFYEFYLVKKGTLIEYRPGSKSIHEPRSLILVNPEQVHAFSSVKSTDECQIINVAFPVSLMDSVMGFLSHQTLFNQVEQGFVIHDVPLLLWQYFCQKIDMLRENKDLLSANKEQIIRVLLAEIVLESYSNKKFKTISSAPGWLQYACNEMKTKTNLDNGLSRFISLSGKSQEHLTRTLKKYHGKTPTQFINILRMQLVESALTTSQTSITNIAYEAGFNNLAYFNSVFRREFGCSPRDYRARSGYDVVPRF